MVLRRLGGDDWAPRSRLLVLRFPERHAHVPHDLRREFLREAFSERLAVLAQVDVEVRGHVRGLLDGGLELQKRTADASHTRVSVGAQRARLVRKARVRALAHAAAACRYGEHVCKVDHYAIIVMEDHEEMVRALTVGVPEHAMRRYRSKSDGAWPRAARGGASVRAVDMRARISRLGVLNPALVLHPNRLQEVLLRRINSAGLVRVGAIFERKRLRHLAVYLAPHVKDGSQSAARTAQAAARAHGEGAWNGQSPGRRPVPRD